MIGASSRFGRLAAATLGAAALAAAAPSLSCSATSATCAAAAPEPPVAAKRPYPVLFGALPGADNSNRGPDEARLLSPARELIDDYFWMRDDARKAKPVLDHIAAENSYTAAFMTRLDPLKNELYHELVGHIQETDTRVPYRRGGYYYYTRTEKGKSYAIHCRKPGSLDAPEQVVLDENELAAGHTQCDVGDVEPSPSHALAAVAVDFSGYETYALRFKDLRSGAFLAGDEIPAMSGDVEWGADDSVVYYTTMDAAHRPHKVWRHRMGTPASQDECLFTEDDEMYWVGLSKSRSGRFLFVHSGTKTTSESHFFDLEAGGDAAAAPQVLQPRVEDLKYRVDHHGDSFFVVTNKDGAVNGKLMRTPVAAPGADNWRDVRPYDPAVNVKGVSCFRDHLVVHGRQDGMAQLWVGAVGGDAAAELQRVEFPEEAYSVGATGNLEFDTTTLRFVYSSLVTPRGTYDYDMASGARELLKETEVPNYEREHYACERVTVRARDGTEVPVSLVYRRDLHPEGPRDAPLMLYGYGSYGACMDPGFSVTRLPYLDRGMAYAIAHIRGGGEQGRTWYETEGKFLKKKNTFNDFVDAAEGLVERRMTAPDKLACTGRSAGGLLIGAVVNARPDLWRVAVADVPFVDVMNTMSDPSIPLTVAEYVEWGAPNDERFFDYMLSYSPYDNVRAQAYPAMLFSGGLNDPRVAYWEPCKMVAKLRDLKTDDNPLLLKIEMDSGHFSAADRYAWLREDAFEKAFVLDMLGLSGLGGRAAYPGSSEAAGGAGEEPRAKL